jgi:hypothetical protein
MADQQKDTQSIDDSQMMVQYPNVLIHEGTRFPFNPHLIQYAMPKQTNHGGYVVNCQYPITGQLADGTRIQKLVPILLQTPDMITTFGMSSREHDGKIKGTIDVTFYDSAGADVQAFYQVMLLWDRLLLKKAKSNKQAWFRSDKITDQILDYLYIPMVRKNTRKSDGKEFADSFRSKIPRRGDRFDAEAYNMEKQPISLDEITRMSVVRMLPRHTGVWFNDKMFVSSFEAPQVQKRGEGRLSGFAFVGDDSDEITDPYVEPVMEMVE